MLTRPCSSERGGTGGSPATRRGTGRCVPPVPSRAEHRKADPRRPDLLERVPHERGSDARSLTPRVDRHNVDLAAAPRPPRRSEPRRNRPPGRPRPRPTPRARTTGTSPRPHEPAPTASRGQHPVHRRPQLDLDAGEDRFPGVEREADDGLDVGLDEAADHDLHTPSVAGWATELASLRSEVTTCVGVLDTAASYTPGPTIWADRPLRTKILAGIEDEIHTTDQGNDRRPPWPRGGPASRWRHRGAGGSTRTSCADPGSRSLTSWSPLPARPRHRDERRQRGRNLVRVHRTGDGTTVRAYFRLASPSEGA